MIFDIIIQFIGQILILMSLGVIYAIFTHDSFIYPLFRKLAMGTVMVLVVVYVMRYNIQLDETGNFFFDVRSLALGISGMFLGIIPTLMGVIAAVLFRINEGGDGITLGIDKIVDTNQIYGFAIRIEGDDSDIGSSESKLDTDSLSLSLYGTLPFSEKTYIDSTLGVGLLRTDLTRIHDSGTLTGKRKGEQVFGSILYGAEFENEVTLSPYGRIDAGYTKLKSFSDTGTVAAINYNEQKIKTARASVGLLIDDEMKTQSAIFIPNARIEYGKDVVDASDAVLSYVVYPNTDYTFKIDREESDNFRMGLGTDILVEGGWILSADFERNQKEGSSYENSINLGASFQPNQNTEYSVSIIGGDSSSRQFGLNYDKSLTDDWTLNAGLEVAKSSNSGYNNTVEFGTRMSF